MPADPTEPPMPTPDTDLPALIAACEAGDGNAMAALIEAMCRDGWWYAVQIWPGDDLHYARFERYRGIAAGANGKTPQAAVAAAARAATQRAGSPQDSTKVNP